MKIRLLALAIAGTTFAGTAVAAPFAPFDVRAAGMGGTGVASAKSASAALFNPAMLSTQVEGDKFQFLLGVGGQFTDSGDLLDGVDDLQTTLDDFDLLIDRIDNENIAYGTYSSTLAETGSLTATLSNQFSAINGAKATVLPGAALGVGVPGKNLGVGVFVGANGLVSISPTIDAADTNRLNRYAGIMADGVVDATDYTNNPDLFKDPITTGGQVELEDFNSQSTVTAVGVLVGEVGIALSRELVLENGGLLSLGVTPKMLDITTYEYTANTEGFDDADIENFETTDSGFDIDVGAVYKMSADAQWQYGVVVKNLIGGSYSTKPNIGTPRKIDLDPQLRAGVARMTNRTTLAADLDITKNTGTTGGDSTQFLALGAEYDLKYLQLRAGYRANLASSSVGDVMTAGIGLGPVDLTAVVGDDTVGAFLQLGFGW
ncbi:MAG: conjugal transfer protein TraF [Gammaproteobacteria bacterium]